MRASLHIRNMQIVRKYTIYLQVRGPSWLWSYGSWMYNYLCNHCLSPLKLSVSSNPAHGEMYLTQHYVIKFVSELLQVGGFLRFPSPIKLTAMI